MPTEFDPRKHKIVAVVTEEGDDKGQHFHLSLPDLVQEIRETKVIEHQAADETALRLLTDRIDQLEQRPAVVTELVPAPSGNVVTEIPEEFAQRLQFIAKSLNVLTARLEALEGEKHLTASDANDLTKAFSVRLDQTVENTVAEAIGDIRGRLATVEQRNPPQIGKQLETLATVVKGLSALVRDIEESVDANKGDLERRYSEIASHIGSVEQRLVAVANFSRGLADLVKNAPLEIERT